MAALLLVGVAARAQAATRPFAAAVPVRAPSADPFRPVRVSAADSAPPPPASTAPARCTNDAQCPAETICDGGACRPFERPIHALLYRKEGPSTAFIPFYWSKRGDTGHRVVAPFYFHFWSPLDRARVVAPFYWRFEDDVRRHFVTVVFAGLPVSTTSEPGARSVAVWPLFYASNRYGWAAPLLLSFSLRNPEAQTSTTLLALLAFSRQTPARTFTWAAPLTFYWRHQNERHLLPLPLAYASWTRSEGDDRRLRENLQITPIGYSSLNGSNERGSLAWIYWAGREGKTGEAYNVLFPLVWSFRSPAANTTIAGLFVHWRRGSHRFDTLPPLFWRSSDSASHEGWGLLVPFAFWRRSDGGHQRSWVSPIGGAFSNDRTGTHTTALLLPPLVVRRTPTTSFTMIAGLYWRARDTVADSDTRVVGPYLSHRDPDGETTAVLPLFFRLRDRATHAHTDLLLPFYFARRNPDERTVAAGVLPLWGYHRSFRDGSSSAGLFPLAFFGNRGEDRHAVVVPLFFHWKTHQAATTVALPLFFRRNTGTATSTFVLPLALYHGTQGARSATVQFPLFWRFRDSASGSATTVVPPVFVHSDRDGWSAGLIPLLFARAGAQRSHFVLFPAIWHFSDRAQDRSSTLALLYFHRRNGDERTDALLPLLWYRRGRAPGGVEETSFTLFPFVHHRHSPTESLWLSPVAITSRTPARRVGFIGPYLWYRDSEIAAKAVLPLFVDLTHLRAGDRTRILGPWFALDAPDMRARALFPLFGHYAAPDGSESGTWVFPTFFRMQRRSDDYHLTTLVPLFWTSRSAHHKTLVLGPWWTHRRDDAHSTGLAPLYLYANSAQRSLIVTPLFYRREEHATGSTQTASLLFFHARRPDGHSTVLFPLWWSSRHGERRRDILFPLYWHFGNRTANGEPTDLHIAGPMFSSRSGDYVTRGLAPVLWWSRDKSGARAEALLPLFYARHGEAGHGIYTLLFGAGGSPTSSWWYVPPVYHRRTPATAFTMVAPFFFQHSNMATQTTTRVVPPLLHFSRSSPDRSLSVWGALFWRRHTIDSSATVLAPFFFDWRTSYASRSTLLLPLLYRHHRYVDDTAYTLAPLFYRRAAPTNSTTVLFPLVWDFKSAPDRRTTLVLPLYVGVQRPTYSAHYVFPNIYWSRGRGTAVGTSRTMVFPFWESAVKRPGDTMWEVLFGLFGYERVGRNRFMRLFFIPVELEPTPAAKTAWYGRPRRAAPPKRDLRAAAW